MQKKYTKNENFINKSVKIMSIIMFATILILMLFIDTNVDYNYKNEVKLKNYMFFFSVIFILIILFILKKFLKNRKEQVKRIITVIESKTIPIIVALFIVLVVFQLLMIRNLYFETTWDVEHLVNTVKNFAKTGVFENNTYCGTFPYFSLYPNNLFLANIFAVISKVVILFGEDYIYKTLMVIGVILVDIAGILMIKTIGNFTDRRIFKIIGMLGFMAFIGVSPWLLVPYSDTYSIFFPISILYNYTKKEKKAYNYLLIGLCSYMGYLIKPTVIIVLIAIVIIEFGKVLTKLKEKSNQRKMAKNLTFVIIGIVMVGLLKFGLSKVTNYQANKEYEISMFHYLMMGISQESTGSFSHNDVYRSLSVDKYEERIKINKEIFAQRLQEMSLRDLCDFYTKKMLVNYNDGTLAWGREGGFYDKINEHEDRLANIMKNFYYNHGSIFYLYTNIMQFIWIFILVFILMRAVLKKFDKNVSVAFLSLIGLTIFLLIFEARARYLYLYSTYYIIISVLGIESFFYKEDEKIKQLESKYDIKKEE